MSDKIPIVININDKDLTFNVESRLLLVDLLRNNLELKGTHIGCDTSQCGACTVHLNGRAVKSCTVLAVQCEESEVTTVEGIGSPEKLHPMQEVEIIYRRMFEACGSCK